MSRHETPVDMQDWGWFLHDPRQPETDLQALMQTAPGDTPQESVEALQEFREAVIDCMLALTAKERFTIEAYTLERLSYSQLGTRLGCSKSQAEREHKKACQTLGLYVKAHPTVQARHPFMEPTNWNDAAQDAINYLRVLSVTTIPAPFELLIADGKKVLSAGWETSGGELTHILTDLGVSALIELGADFVTRQSIVDMLCDRHRKYGMGNILEFREYGLLIRMSDKVARIANDAGDFADETTIDAYMDLVGYAAIAHMLSQGTFTLPLKETTNA